MSRIEVLLVEDEHPVAQDIQGMLEVLGYAVADVVSTGEDAVRTGNTVARLGENEFGLLLPEVSEEKIAVEIIGRVVVLLKKGLPASLSLTTGSAIFPRRRRLRPGAPREGGSGHGRGQEESGAGIIHNPAGSRD
jgi:hypothetical protein